MLKLRVLTIVVLAPLVIAFILLSPWEWLRLGLAAVILIAGYEWAKLFGLTSFLQRSVYALLILLMALLGDYFAEPINLYSWVFWLAAAWWLIIIALLVRISIKGQLKDYTSSVKALMGLLTLLPFWFAFSVLYSELGAKIILYIMVVVWFADIGAYIVGRLLGRHKLAPIISPGKTIEGVIGGLVCVVIFAVIAAQYLDYPNLSLIILVLLSSVVAIVSVVGDLFESLLKRQAGLKDSGNLLPGHGGMLDRIDSLIAAVPLFALGLQLAF